MDVGSSHLPVLFIAGNQSTTSQFGELAQLGERLVCNQEVTGSSPVFSTKFVSILLAPAARGS
jgi:hypothetical protein